MDDEESVFWSRSSVNSARFLYLETKSSGRSFLEWVRVWGLTLCCIVVVSGVVSCKPKPTTPAPITEDEFRVAREKLAAELGGRIKDQRVLEAIRTIPRHEFVPERYQDKAYDDTSVPIAEDQHISQPFVAALMAELLELKGGEKVLEVGTGIGYQAAILGRLVAEVYSIEIRKSLKESAGKKLKELRERQVLTCKELKIILGDGSRGYPKAAPYDCIIVTAACSSVHPELFEQLKPGGRLVIPVGKRTQELKLIHKLADGSRKTETIKIVRFPLIIEQ